MCSFYSVLQEARAAGLKAPVILMGYYNPLLAFGEKKMVQAATAAGEVIPPKKKHVEEIS